MSYSPTTGSGSGGEVRRSGLGASARGGKRRWAGHRRTRNRSIFLGNERSKCQAIARKTRDVANSRGESSFHRSMVLGGVRDCVFYSEKATERKRLLCLHGTCKMQCMA